MRKMIIDTSSKILYISFLDNDKEIYQVANTGLNNHSENLIADIQKGLEICNLEVKDFDEIIVGIGPGSYTGLRVGLTVAKMFSWTLQIPLYTVSSLDVLASGYLDQDGIYAIVASAKRDSIYGKVIKVQSRRQTVLLPDQFTDIDSFKKKIEQYDYVLIDQNNYCFNPRNIKTEKVEDLHQLTPNYLQKEV
jgi:tRNA threonylcarbamoyladenosine biosynthesis protein TsaB